MISSSLTSFELCTNIFIFTQAYTVNFPLTMASLASSRSRRVNAGANMSKLLDKEEAVNDDFYKTHYGGFDEVSYKLIVIFDQSKDSFAFLRWKMILILMTATHLIRKM